MLKYKHYHRTEKVPFIVYADFESYIRPLQSCDPNPESSYTKQYQKHEPSSFCYYIKCFDDEVYELKLVSYTGEDAAQKFVNMLEEDIKKISNIPKKKMIFGEKEKRIDKETKCWICNKECDDDVKNDKVRDLSYSIGFIAKQELDMTEDVFLLYVTGVESGACHLFKEYKTIVRFFIDSESERSFKWTEHEYIINLVEYYEEEIKYLNEAKG